MAIEEPQPGYERLVEISTNLRDEYSQDSMHWWAESPFAWIRLEGSGRRGKIGEQLVERLCRAYGLEVEGSTDSDCDLLIAGVRVEVKFSTRWATGQFRFQQIRDQNYKLAVCLGVAPSDARMWAIPKETLLARPAGVRGQHGGAEAQDTMWLTVRPGKEHEWMHKFGGALPDGMAALREQIELQH